MLQVPPIHSNDSKTRAYSLPTPDDSSNLKVATPVELKVDKPGFSLPARPFRLSKKPRVTSNTRPPALLTLASCVKLLTRRTIHRYSIFMQPITQALQNGAAPTASTSLPGRHSRHGNNFCNARTLRTHRPASICSLSGLGALSRCPSSRFLLLRPCTGIISHWVSGRSLVVYIIRGLRGTRFWLTIALGSGW